MRPSVRAITLGLMLLLIAVVANSCALAPDLSRRTLTVAGRSMEPTLCNGDNTRLRHFDGTLARGDIVGFQLPLDPTRDFIKRVIGLPRETVEVRDGNVLIDGSPLNEPYTLNKPDYTYGPKTVPDGEYFVL